MTAALDAAGIRLGATHTEVKLTADGPALIEINPRPAGGMIPELIRLATGVDLLGEQLRAALGLPPHLKAEDAGHAGIQFLLAGADGTLTAARGTQEAAAVEGVESVLVTAVPGTPVRRPRSASDRLGHVIARHPEPEGVHAALDAARALLRLDIEPPQHS